MHETESAYIDLLGDIIPSFSLVYYASAFNVDTRKQRTDESVPDEYL